MNNSDWVLLDTETVRTAGGLFVVEVSAQRMRGWIRIGEPFQRLINHSIAIPGGPARGQSYTREILERDGDPPVRVYSALREYARNLPVVSYGLAVMFQ